MKTRAIDIDGDWVFGIGLQAYATGSAGIAFDIQMSVRMVLNDCFFSPVGWIDWFNLLGSSNQSALLFQLRSVIENVVGVNKVTQLSASLDRTNRSFSVRYNVDTVYGTAVTNDLVFPVTPSGGINKFVGDIFFDGVTTSVDVDVSSGITNARDGIWIVYDNSDGYTPVVGAVTILGDALIRITINPAPLAGFFRLVGIS